MQNYNLAKVLQLLSESLTDDDLHDLCFTAFRRVYDNFSAGQTRNMRQRLLVDYAVRQREVQRLFDGIRCLNPTAFAEFESDLVARPAAEETAVASRAFVDLESHGSAEVLDVSLLTTGSVSLELWGDPSDMFGRMRQQVIHWARENDQQLEAAYQAAAHHIPDLNEAALDGSADDEPLGLEAVTLRIPLQVTNRGNERTWLKLTESGQRVLDTLRPPIADYELRYRVSLLGQSEPRIALDPGDPVEIELEVFLECRPRTAKPSSAVGVISTCNRIRVARWFADVLQQSANEPLTGFQIELDRQELDTANAKFAVSVTREQDPFAYKQIDIDEVESNLQRVVRAGEEHFISLAFTDPESQFPTPPDMQPVEPVAKTSAQQPTEVRDFFVSYNRSDKLWAEWIAWTLEEAGYSVYIQAWDFRPGSNFVLEMHKATRKCDKTIVVLSDHYLTAEFTHPEWAAAFAQDPQGQQRMLVPVRVRECQPDGLLASIVYVDLVNLPEPDARIALLGAFSNRAKPPTEPTFPGSRTEPAGVKYPGKSTSLAVTSSIDLEHRADVEHTNSDESAAATSSVDRLELIKSLNGLPPQQFNMLVFVVNPPPGIVPPMPAPQGDRRKALLAWAESSAGCGLENITEIVQKLSNQDSRQLTPLNGVTPPARSRGNR